MLTGDEFEEIRGVLTQILAVNGGRVWLQSVYTGPAFIVELNEKVGQAASDDQVAAAAIRVCMLREWQDDPCWLVRLLNQVKANSGAGGIGGVTNVDAIIKRLKRKVNVLNEAWHVPWVRDGLPFIDRTLLRETLKEVACLAGRPILRIEGESGSGKTYSSELLEYVSQSGAWSFRVIKVPVEEGSEIMMNALVLAQIIVGEMGFKNSVADSGLSDPTVHHIPLLQTWILQCARSSGKQWWLFLDGFRALPETNSARDLIQGLADKIANGNYRQWLRLVLSDYDKPLSRVEEERVAFDRPDQRLSDDIALLAVRECLEHLYKEIGRTAASGEIEAKSQAVLTGLPNGQSWIETLSKRLRAVAKGIRNGQ